MPKYSTPKSYTPKHLAEKILTSKAALEGERKQVTVLFCDIANSTALAERLGADEMHALLDRFFDLALAEVHRYEGTVNQFLGDGFMALFGAPVAHEDHARRAALAALGLQRALQESPALGTTTTGQLSVRIGLNTGAVVVGKIGDNLRMDYTAIGDATNLAARLQQLAPPHAIYAGERTYRLVAKYVHCEALGERTVKGKNEPVKVYQLLGPRSLPGHAEGGIRPVGSILVGRGEELGVLNACLERLQAGEGAIVGILGEAGFGKSRLVTEAKRRFTDHDRFWLEGRALSFGQTLSYWPFLEVLRQWAGITEEDKDEQGARKLERHVRELFPDEGDEVLPYLATLLGLPVAPGLEHRVKYLDGQAMGRQIFRSVWRLFERLARARPVVLVFEDLHWADQSSTELIEHLFPLVETVPLLICGNGRLDRDSPAMRLRATARTTYAARYTEISLGPLSPAASGTLLQNLLVSGQVPAQLSEVILRKAEGNPFFVEEVVRSLIATGVLAWDKTTEQWRAIRRVDQVTIPDTLQAVVMARVDRLDDDVKQVLKAASVIGRSFLYRVLKTIADAARDLDPHLDALQELELIREKRQVPELEYFFKHGLVQEATYESILLERRRQLHRVVGESIERLFVDRLEEFYGLLAYHYASAEDWGKAQEYLFKAGDHAGRVAADAEALTHYRAAIQAYGRVFGDRWDPIERAILDRKIGEALFRRGEHEQSREYLERAVTLLRGPYPTSRLGIRWAIVAQLLRQLVHRALPGMFVGRTAPGTDLIGDELYRLHDVLGWIEYFTDPERFVLGTLTGLNFFEGRGHPAGRALHSMALGLICDVIPAFSVAAHYHRRAITLAQQTSNPIALGHARLGMGLHEEALGQLKAAYEDHRRSADAFREAGHLRGWAAGVLGAVYILHHLGEFTRAVREGQELIRVGEETSDPQILAWGMMVRGIVRRCTGPLDAAIADLQGAMHFFERIPDHAGIAQASGVLGACYLHRGELAEAQGVLERANRLIAERRLRGLAVASAPLFFAEACFHAFDAAPEGARAAMLKRAGRASKEALRQARMLRHWLPMALRMRGMFEWRAGRPTVAARWWRDSLATAEQLEEPYERARTLVEIGRCGGTRAELEEAEKIFARIGATPALVEAQGLLERMSGQAVIDK